uniref:Si:ch211-103f14.3 n=1 Tax=Seriola dumerili TaxID=41447 RepID=A0A3B4T297_SERDU
YNDPFTTVCQPSREFLIIHSYMHYNDVVFYKHTDISVECGTSSISLAILICPVVYTGYNESLLILNHIFNKPECQGTLDESSNLPVVRFTFPINMTNACGSTFLTTSAAGTGIFADFSNIQTVNISGVVHSHDPTTGIVTYNAELKYYYSCAYPLEYLINNTQVEVYHVLMDRCYASISPQPANSTFFNLFVSCSKDQMTTMHENGDSHHARFSFPAFRFVEQQNQTMSTYYLHCITRLCEISTCNDFKQCNNRRRRDVRSTGVSEATTLSSVVPIVTRNENCKSANQ